MARASYLIRKSFIGVDKRKATGHSPSEQKRAGTVSLSSSQQTALPRTGMNLRRAVRFGAVEVREREREIMTSTPPLDARDKAGVARADRKRKTE